MNPPFYQAGFLVACLFVPSSAWAQTQQVDGGLWSCPGVGQYANEDHTQNCTGINFAKPFAEPPKMMLSATNNLFTVFDLNAINVTELGFVPHLRSGGGTGWHGNWVAIGSSLVTGFLKPRYVILTIVYAPPGSGGGQNSNVLYSADSTTGITTSSGQSFTTTNSIKVDASGGLFETGGGTGISFDYSVSSGDSSSVDIKKSSSTIISRNGTSTPGVNHEDDQILVWLNPVIATSASPTSVAWHFDQTAPAVLQWLTVRELKNSASMAEGTRRLLGSYGVTESDFSTISTQDPFSDPSYKADSKRFVPISFWFPYQPPTSPGGTVPTLTYKLTASNSLLQTHSADQSYKVGLTVMTSVGAGDFLKLKLTDSASWTWENKSSKASTTASGESAQLTIGGPPAGYSGSTQVAVSYDILYKTFNFEMVPLPELANPSRVDVLVDQAGRPRAGVIVSTTVGDRLYRSVTDASGRYRFYDPKAASGTVVVPEN